MNLKNEQGRSQGKHERTTSKHDQLARKVENSKRSHRNANLMRMVFVPVVFTILFIILIVAGHDLFVKTHSITSMEKIGQLIKEYRLKNNHWPTRSTFERIAFEGSYLSAIQVNYDDKMLPPQAPDDIILAHTNALPLRLLPDRHVVLYLNGKVDWVAPAQLGQQIRQRDRLYHSQIFKSNSD